MKIRYGGVISIIDRDAEVLHLSTNCGGATERKVVMRSVSRIERPTPKSVKDVYYNEFGFLQWIQPDKDGVEFICVEQIDLELMEVVPHQAEEFYQDDVCVFLVDNLGLKIMEVEQRRRERAVRFSFLRPSTWLKTFFPGISVKQALLDLGDELQSLAYVVVVTRPRWWSRIQIFKLPKRFSLQEWIKSERQKLRERILEGKEI